MKKYEVLGKNIEKHASPDYHKKTFLPGSVLGIVHVAPNEPSHLNLLSLPSSLQIFDMIMMIPFYTEIFLDILQTLFNFCCLLSWCFKC